MNSPRSDADDHIPFLLAAQRVFTCTEAARRQPDGEQAPAHDSFTRLLQRQPSNTEPLWGEVKDRVRLDGGVLVVDDTTLDKPYARKMELATYHCSGKHRQVVVGINLLTLLWTDGEAPCRATSGSMTSRWAGTPKTSTSAPCWRWPTAGVPAGARPV